MTKEDIVIVWLTIQLSVMTFMYCKSLKQAAYLQGKLDTYEQFSAHEDDGTCFAKGGCK